jgi:hypothetical protein
MQQTSWGEMQLVLLHVQMPRHEALLNSKLTQLF